MGNLSPLNEFRQGLVREYERYVATVAAMVGSTEDEVREALHTVACRILDRLGTRPRWNAVVAWRPYIIRSVVNELRQMSRGQARRKNTLILFSELDEEGQRHVAGLRAPQLPPDKQAERNELVALARAELRKLPPRRRYVIARFCEDYTFAEIAEALGIDVVTARRHFNIGIRELRHRLRRAA